MMIIFYVPEIASLAARVLFAPVLGTGLGARLVFT